MKTNHELTKRKCKKEDHKFVYNLTKKTLFPYIFQYFKPSKKRFTQGFNKDYKQIIILLKGKRRIGFYQLTPLNKQLDITRIFLSPNYQGKGIGSNLMKDFEGLGYKKITLQVWDNNPAVKFYKKIGYKRIKEENHKIHMEKNAE